MSSFNRFDTIMQRIRYNRNGVTKELYLTSGTDFQNHRLLLIIRHSNFAMCLMNMISDIRKSGKIIHSFAGFIPDIKIEWQNSKTVLYCKVGIYIYNSKIKISILNSCIAILKGRYYTVVTCEGK